MTSKKSKIIVAMGLTVLLLGAGVVLGQSTQRATSPMTAPLDRDWTENFDSYATGSALAGQGGWFPWDGAAANTGYVVADQARSAPNSAEIKWTSSSVWVDMVHAYTGVNSGNWTFSAWLFVPSTMTGNSYFILMNKYVNGTHNNQDWSLQLEFSVTNGNHIYDFNDVTKTLPLVTDAWALLQVSINFDVDKQTIYYNGQLLENAGWKDHVTPGGQLALEAVDLYADSAFSTAVYWDDLSVMPPAPPLTCDADGPYTGETGSPVQFTGSATGGTPPYTWEWEFGDGATSTDQNPTHIYTAPGEYQVHLTVTDSMAVTADDETTATIVEAPEPNIVIEKISGGRAITVTVTNNGNADATMVPWKINLTGGFILKGRTASGTVPKIAIGETKNLTSKVLGFGKVTITATVGDKTKTATGFVFLMFVLGVK